MYTRNKITGKSWKDDNTIEKINGQETASIITKSVQMQARGFKKSEYKLEGKASKEIFFTQRIIENIRYVIYRTERYIYIIRTIRFNEEIKGSQLLDNSRYEDDVNKTRYEKIENDKEQLI